MIKTCYICDICGAERKETNHWFAANVGRTLVLRQWEDKQKGNAHICGQECVHKMLDKWMSEKEKGKADAGPAEKEASDAGTVRD